MKINKRKLILSVIVLALGMAVYGVQRFLDDREGKSIQIVEETSESTEQVTSLSDRTPIVTEESGTTSASIEATFPVYVCGGIRNPGVYEIHAGMYLYELIELAGGLCDNAAIENIDMVYWIDQAQSIYIPIRETSESSRSWNDFKEVRTSSWNEEQTGSGPDPGLVNINTCGVSELCTLPGIGEKTAEKIIGYRQEHGKFLKKEDLCQVPGIGSGKYSSIEDLICV